jgi:acetate kinase
LAPSLTPVRVLVVNAGSSSVKLSLIGTKEETVAERELPAPRLEIERGALEGALADGLGDADAVGHRIVHGGRRFSEPIVIEPDTEAALRELVELAPLHQPKSIAALDAVSAALPDRPAVACFDTAFHATLPEAAATYALPARWRDRWGVRRYGFHGLSHAWVARHLPELLGRRAAGLRIVSCHLGAGASVCAIDSGRSVDTTMGFTPLEGLVMATRSGSVDPGLLLWLLSEARVTVPELADGLEHDSGLLGLSGTADMREALLREAGGQPAAHLGVETYLHRLRASVAAMAASLGGLDALAFTGGVGQNSADVRSRTTQGLRFLGVEVDDGLNAHAEGDADVTAPGARVKTVVLRAREDLEIARQVRGVLAVNPGA